MKFINHRQAKRLATLALIVSLSAGSVYAKKKADEPIQPRTKSEYNFKLKSGTPEGMARYSLTLYPYLADKVYTLQGFQLADVGNPIVQIVFNPSGVNFAAITKDKKGRSEASLFDPREENKRITKFKTKNLGNPTAFAFTPDARNMILATDGGVYLMDHKQNKPVSRIDAGMTPTAMIMSPNGYYLAMTDGHNVKVLNFEEQKERKSWKLDDTTVNGIIFSDDSSMFGVLTDDGLLTIYDTRNFSLKQTVDNLGKALAASFNFDGKYIAVATSANSIEVINLLRDNERDIVDVPDGVLNRLIFIPDYQGNTLMAYNVTDGVTAKRMYGLEPYYGKLMADEVAERMNEWLKMMPGESMAEYQARVNDKSRAAQQRLFEDEISTNLANNLLSMSAVTLGKYDRANQLLEVDFTNMPSILLPVPEADLGSFTNGDDLQFSDAKYGIMPNDNFELIYAKVYNKANGKSYLFDNLERRPLSFMEDNDNVVSLEIIQQQQMEEMKLQEIRQQVVEEAKQQNIISDRTNITVDSKVTPEYDANGNRILNYDVKFSYEVDPEFSVVEDFGPGKYHVDESGAASSMLAIVKQAFEGDFAQYVKDGKKLRVNISGTADATPIVRTIAYDGAYGDFEDEPVRQNGQLIGITVTSKTGVKENPQLALLRAAGVRNYLQNNVKDLNKMNADYNYIIDVSEDRGSAFRRITVEFTFVDVF